MERNIFLTVAVPTYNGARTIRKMLEILLPQVNDEIEVLISDNCSTDETPQIISSYQGKYPQIKYIRNEKNLGADGNFLQCMMLAEGQFTMLISDDDIIVEDAIGKITAFLRAHPDVQLAYLDTVGFKNEYKGRSACHKYKEFSPVIEESIVTQNKQEFLHYAQRMWGFTSTFVWNTARMKAVDHPEQYYNTYFLQSYMHISCANRPDDMLGVIQGPCIAVGEYGIIGNYDTAQVEGVFYRRMIKTAVACGFPQKDLEEYYVWKLRHLVIRTVIKEKVAGVKKTHVKSVIQATQGLPLLRAELLATFLIPRRLCQLILKKYRRSKGVSADTYVNRPTEQKEEAE